MKAKGATYRDPVPSRQTCDETICVMACGHSEVATGYVNDDTETYCVDCGLVLMVNGVPEGYTRSSSVPSS